MRKAKIVALLLTVICMVFLFASCGGLNESKDSETPIESDAGNVPATTQQGFEADESIEEPFDSEEETQVIGDQQETNTDNEQETNDDENDKLKIEQSQIYKCDGYSEGLAFVDIGNSRDPQWCCIDKKGTIVFTVENYTPIYGFNNGYALMSYWSDHQQQYALCDTQGNIITIEDLGGTSVIVESDYDNYDQYLSEMFSEGYLFIRKTSTSFNGSVDELALFALENGRWEKAIDFSTELNTVYSEKIKLSKTYYYNGFLFWQGEYIDLENGEICEGVSDLYTKMELKNKSDFWAYHWDGNNYFIYDKLAYLLSTDENPEYTSIIDLSQYNTIDSISNYSNGICGVTFKVLDPDVGYRNYFTIMNEEGMFEFEPVEVGKDPEVRCEDGVCLLSFLEGRYNMSAIEYIEHILVFDSTGKLGEIEIPLQYNDRFTLKLTDSIIVFGNWGEDYVALYTLELAPLF